MKPTRGERLERIRELRNWMVQQDAEFQDLPFPEEVWEQWKEKSGELECEQCALEQLWYRDKALRRALAYRDQMERRVLAELGAGEDT